MLNEEKPNILIVDDDRQNLLSVCEILKDLDVVIDSTTKAKEAIYLINHKRYALLIFDVHMPEMGGFQLAEIIQNGYHNSKTPIIFISGTVFDQFSIFKGYRSGAVDYLTKPLRTEILRSKVKVLLELEKAKLSLKVEKEKAQKALDDKTLFVAKVSHEIRNPLSVVISIIDLLEEDISPDEKHEYLNIMRSSSVHMLRLLDDLVDYTKAEVGSVELENVAFNIENELKVLIKSSEIQSKESGNKYSYTLDNDIPDTLFGDITRYKQIAYNLLGNANKFTKNGEINIHIKLQSKTEDHIIIATEIKDDGIGMTEEEQKQLFKPFSQSNQTITRKYGGSGLGLAIARKLCDLMNGEISLISEKGKGSTFIFTVKLPINGDY